MDLVVPTDIVCRMLENINRDLRTSHFNQYGGRRRRRGGRRRDDAVVSYDDDDHGELRLRFFYKLLILF